jgi:hypothetical protein
MEATRRVFKFFGELTWKRYRERLDCLIGKIVSKMHTWKEEIDDSDDEYDEDVDDNGKLEMIKTKKKLEEIYEIEKETEKMWTAAYEFVWERYTNELMKKLKQKEMQKS